MANIYPTNTTPSGLNSGIAANCAPMNPADYNFAEAEWSDILRYRFKRKVQILQFCDVVGKSRQDDVFNWTISPAGTFSTYVSTGASSTTQTLADTTLMSRGTILRFETAAQTWAYRYVTSVASSTSVVVSATISTTTGYPVQILGQKQIAGDIPDNTPVEEVTQCYNALQEYNVGVNMAKTTATKKQLYGLSNKQVTAIGLLDKAAVQMGRQLYYGQYVAPTATTPGEAGGLSYYIDNYSGGSWDVAGNLQWQNIVDYIIARMNVGGFTGSTNYIFCNPTFAGYLEKLRKLANTSIDLWNVTASGYTQIGIAGAKFIIVVDPILIEPSRTGTARSLTGEAFFVSGTDANGTNNLKILYDGDTSSSLTQIGENSTHLSGGLMEIYSPFSFELGEPQMHLRVYNATGAAADS